MSDREIFTSPINDITYEMVAAFCQVGFDEDIDLDYKSDWPNDFDRLLCAFANTQGGIALIGVEEVNKTRKPKCPPVGVAGEESVLHQKALNIGMDAVYPPVIPEVQICEIPGNSNHSVVLVRVNPSRLMHAVDRRRRVYIRVKDSNRGYELASITELEWLWRQREKVEELRNNLMHTAVERSNSPAINWENEEYMQTWVGNPRLIISSLPNFPKFSGIINTHELMKQVNEMGTMKCSWKGIYATLPQELNQWRSISGGISLSHRGHFEYQNYIELGQHGLCYVSISLPLSKRNNQDTERFIMAFAILAYLEMALKFISKFYEKNNYAWPITLSAKLENVSNICLNFNLKSTMSFSYCLSRTIFKAICCI